MSKELSAQTLALLRSYQQDEINGHLIYCALAKRVKKPGCRQVLQRMAADEKKHAAVWQSYTGAPMRPNRLRVFWFGFLGLVMGYTFVLKLLEKGEYVATGQYNRLLEELPEAESIVADEQRHEDELKDMLDEERLHYVGAMVLGLNDALVELTGTLAGLTFAMANTRLVALSGIITGVSATLSMAASNYLAERADGNEKALKSSLYTGAAYLVTVVLLVLPYLLFPPHLYLAALGTMLAVVVLVILFFNYYISVAKGLPFARRFAEMAAISLGVAVISFGIGLLVKQFLGIDV